MAVKISLDIGVGFEENDKAFLLQGIAQRFRGKVIFELFGQQVFKPVSRINGIGGHGIPEMPGVAGGGIVCKNQDGRS